MSVFSAIFVLKENRTQSHSARFLNWGDHVNSVPDLAACPRCFGKHVKFFRFSHQLYYMVRTSSEKQISRTFQGFFKDKLQFSRTTIYSINRHYLTLFWTPYWLKNAMESFTIFTFFSHGWSHYLITTFRNKTMQNDWLWLAIASEV